MNLSWTAGGSSGGEAAIVAFKGSPLGVGTDIAGSIRVPAACCGVYGFMPTANRVPYGGQTSPRETALPGILGSAGPIAQNLDDIELFMEVIANENPWKYDVTALSAPWVRMQPVEGAKLIVGVMFESEQFPLHPPIRRAIESAAFKLQAVGHTVVSLPHDPILSVSYGSRLAFQLFDLQNHGTMDPIKNSGEPMVPSVAMRSSPIDTGPLPVSEELELGKKIIALNHARFDYADRWRKTWVQYNLDVVLSPTAQATAVSHDSFGWPPYTVMWNLLNVSGTTNQVFTVNF